MAPTELPEYVDREYLTYIVESEILDERDVEPTSADDHTTSK